MFRIQSQVEFSCPRMKLQVAFVPEATDSADGCPHRHSATASRLDTFGTEIGRDMTIEATVGSGSGRRITVTIEMDITREHDHHPCHHPSG